LVLLQGDRIVRSFALPEMLLCAALGLGLAFAARRCWGSSIIALITTSMAAAHAPVPPDWLDGVFLGCWISATINAATVYLPHGITARTALALSLNSGIWCGALVSLSGSPFDLVRTLPSVLVVVPSGFVSRRAPLAGKVVSSWLIAVAALTATLQFLSVTPGYMPDHLE
jgi:hypothetical protein